MVLLSQSHRAGISAAQDVSLISLKHDGCHAQAHRSSGSD